MRLLVAALLLAFPAFANITSSSLTGRVIIGEAPGVGVTVTASSAALQQPRATTTNAHGRYWLGALPPGVYDVTFSLEGHTTLTKRAVLELARVARADATLEANPDEDSVTSTASQISVADTITITTHYDDQMLDRMPLGRIETASLGPGLHLGSLSIVDGVMTPGFVTTEETIEQITVIRGATPVEWNSFATGTAIAARTRSGSDELSFTLRDTITNEDDTRHFGEATLGGRIVPQRLWFFAAAWLGEQEFPYPQKQDGTMVKVDAQIGAAHHVDASYSDGELGPEFSPSEIDIASLRYTGAIGLRFTSEVVAGRTMIESGSLDEASWEDVSARASYALGDHLFTAGASAQSGNGGDWRALFASDRWSFSRWNVYAGVRYHDSDSEERLSPRVALTYDLRGNGRHALSASWGEFTNDSLPQLVLRTSTLGYAIAIGNSGAARVDALRRTSDDWWLNELQLDARYRLFDRFEAGATYVWRDQYESGFQQAAYPTHAANVWTGVELPVGSHEFGVTVLQRYVEYEHSTSHPTDLALRYSIPISRVGMMVAADAIDLFASERAVRLWIRLRL